MILLTLWLFRSLLVVHTAAFLGPNQPSKSKRLLLSTRSWELLDTPVFRPIFDFTDSSRNETGRFERLDDAIMGGISTSCLRQVSGEAFARWSGVCRLDGGGFCGVRTLPFHEPLDVSNGDAIYVTCRLNSDLEAHRRIWKLTVRTDRTRGEQVYQSILTIPSTKQKDEFFTLQVPFESLRLVRGARLVPEANPFNNTKGVYQIGLVLSKFSMAEQMTAMPNFRPGFFELLLKDIGVVYKNAAAAAPSSLTVASLTKMDANAKRPMLIKTLMPLSRIIFTEKSQRRKSAMRILKEKRGLSRLEAVMWGINWRARQIGMMRAVAGVLSIGLADAFRGFVGSFLFYGLYLPLRQLWKSVAISKLTSSSTNKEGKVEEA